MSTTEWTRPFYELYSISRIWDLKDHPHVLPFRTQGRHWAGPLMRPLDDGSSQFLSVPSFTERNFPPAGLNLIEPALRRFRLMSSML